MVITPFSVNDTLVSLIEHACRRFATRTAFINMNTSLTFQQLDDKASAFAGYLKQHEHLKRGDRVAIMMPNLLQYPIVLYGVLKAGMVATTINPLYTADELAHQLRDSGAKAIVLVSFAAPPTPRRSTTNQYPHSHYHALRGLLIQALRVAC